MKSLLIIILIASSFALYAQEGNSQEGNVFKSKHEVGVNTQLFQNLISSSNTNTPYSLTYKWIWAKHAIRFGMGGDFDRHTEKEAGYSDSETTLNYSLDARLGFEWRKQWDKLLVYAGTDIAWTQVTDKFIVDSGFDKVTDAEVTRGLGLGGALGLQYYFNERLSISTEGGLYVFNKEKNTARLFQNFPEFDDELNFSKIIELQKILPASININYTF